MYQQLSFIDSGKPEPRLPMGYQPVVPEHFHPERIYLSKGSLSSNDRKRFVERICRCFGDAEVIERLDTAHNKIDLGEPDPLARHRKGKRTLVFGELGDSVRFSSEEQNTCPNYWHFSPYSFCPYGCKYCYLAGTPGVWFSPTVKIYVNLPEIIQKIDATANRLAEPTAFYLGKLQDGLALDPLTAYSTVLAPFFARHRYARQIILTKSADVGRLLDLDHGGHTILSWSINPPEVVRRSEENVPSVDDRLNAMQRCAEHEYPVRAVMMPMIPVEDWEDIYADFVRRLLGAVRLERLTLGGICSYRNASHLMERKWGKANDVSNLTRSQSTSSDGRLRYKGDVRARMYGHVIRIAREIRPDLELALCLEEHHVWQAVGLTDCMGRCNCVL